MEVATIFIFVQLLPFKIMNMFLVVTIVVSSLFLAVFQAVQNIRLNSCTEGRNGASPYLYLFGSIMFVCDVAAGGDYILRMPADLISVVFPLIVVNSSQWKPDAASRMVRLFLIVQSASILYYLLCHFRVFRIMDADDVMLRMIVSVIFIAALYAYALWCRIYDIKELMKSGTVWSYVNLVVDCIYVLSLISSVAVFSYCVQFTRIPENICKTALLVVLWLEMLALGLRYSMDSVFVIMQKHERIIVESMKISQVEVSSAGSREDDVYREIYERVLLHFEMKKPFLDHTLTINDVVTVVYSNKVYISKAISHYTGRNFRQFVNYYRVMHSIDAFRQRPSMKVAELASLSGFNSVVSYSTAFRLFMNETPSEWCRKEKTKLIKMKK